MTKPTTKASDGDAKPRSTKPRRVLPDRTGVEAVATAGWPPVSMAPDWIEWMRKASIDLEDAVALSLGAEPRWDQLLVNPEASQALPRPVPGTSRRVCVAHIPGAPAVVEWHHAALTTDEGRRRLELMRKHHGTAALPPAPSKAGRLSVRPIDLAKFAKCQGWQIPAPLASLTMSKTSADSPAVPAQKLGPSRREAVLSALKEKYGDVMTLPEYLEGAHSGDPVIAVAKRALPGVKDAAVRSILRALRQSGEIDPRDRWKRKG